MATARREASPRAAAASAASQSRPTRAVDQSERAVEFLTNQIAPFERWTNQIAPFELSTNQIAALCFGANLSIVLGSAARGEVEANPAIGRSERREVLARLPVGGGARSLRGLGRGKIGQEGEVLTNKLNKH